jgi:hypothetical protein
VVVVPPDDGVATVHGRCWRLAHEETRDDEAAHPTGHGRGRDGDGRCVRAAGRHGARQGHDDDRVERRGFCTNGARWDIRAESDDGRIEVDAEIDTSRTGRRWTWVLKHNGSVSARGTSRTRPPSGSFEVERYSIDLSGTDTFRFRASRKGARCVATISW